MIHSFLSIFPLMVCLFWTAVYLLEWRENNPAKRVLTLFMATCTVLYLCHALFFNRLSTSATDCIYDFCNLAVFPLYLIYICRLTGSRPLSWRHALLLLPAALAGISGCLAGCCPPAVLGARGIIVKAVFLLQLPPICWIGFRRLSDFDRQVSNFFSNTEQRSVRQTRNMMAVLLFCSCCSAVASLVGREHFLFNPSRLLVPSLGFGSLLFAVGFVGQKQVFCAETLATPENPEEAEEAEGGGNPEKSPLLKSIEAQMLAERLYLQPDLRLSDVAAMFSVSRTTLSAAINQSAGVSFSDFVNGYRVRHAQGIMRSNPQSASFSVIQIAEQSGFSNESSFYRAFRKHTGMTPKQWLAQGKAEG